jgi:hypothetical protein
MPRPFSSATDFSITFCFGKPLSPLTNDLAIGWFERSSIARNGPSDAFQILSVLCLNIFYSEFPGGKRSCFIKYHKLGVGHSFDGVATFYQDAVLCSAPKPTITAVGCSQGPWRKGRRSPAQQWHASCCFAGRAFVSKIGYHKSEQCYQYHHRHKYRCYLIAQFLYGWLGCLRLLHQIDDLRGVLLLPTLVAIILILPSCTMVPPITVSYFFFCTGMLSPVIIASLIDASPESISPSTGT